jgi:hypothetical protein
MSAEKDVPSPLFVVCLSYAAPIFPTLIVLCHHRWCFKKQSKTLKKPEANFPEKNRIQIEMTQDPK